MMPVFTRVLSLGMLCASFAGAAELALEIPGGMAQIKVFCTGTGAVASGRLEFVLPADVFGAVKAADVFSAMGHALGLAYSLGEEVRHSLHVGWHRGLP